jgi:hypothetical protein
MQARCQSRDGAKYGVYACTKGTRCPYHVHDAVRANRVLPKIERVKGLESFVGGRWVRDGRVARVCHVVARGS